MNSSRKPQSAGSEESEKFGAKWKEFKEGPSWKGPSWKKKDTKATISKYAPNCSSNHGLTSKSGKIQRKGFTEPWGKQQLRNEER